MNKIFIIAIAAVVITALSIYLVTESVKSEKVTQSITVNENSQEKIIPTQAQDAESILLLCDIDEHCIVESLQELAKQQDDEIVYGTIDKIMAYIDDAGIYCHAQGHHIGIFLYAHAQDLSKALLTADRKCGGSMYHGIVETYFMTEVLLEGTNVEDVQITNSCEQLADDSNSVIYLECVHGIGHGLVKAYSDIFPAVQRCDEFETQVEQNRCQQGVFMANAVEYYATGGGVFDEDDLLYPCNQLDSKYTSNCYYYHVSYILKKTNSVTGSFQQCDRIIDEKQIQSCYAGIGRQLIFSVKQIEDVIDYCQTGNPEYHGYCFWGGIIAVTDQLGLDEGFETCQLYPDEFQLECYSFMGSWISRLNLTPEQIDEQCSKAGQLPYYKACLQFSASELVD